MQIERLPTPIQAYLDGYTSSGENLKTCSSSGVYFYEHPEKAALYLKVFRPSDAPREATLLAESTAVEWLQGKAPVPKLIAYREDQGMEYMLTTAVQGLPSFTAEAAADTPALIELLAKGLRHLHALPIGDCPLDNRIDIMCQRVEQWFSDGVLTLDELPEGFRKATLEESVREIRRLRPAEEDLVFTHGDYCLPNILVEDGHITGYIDLGYAGIGDRYCDFICIDYTIRRNLGDEWVQPFWDAYDVEIDPVKFSFYEQLHWIL